MTFFSNNSPFGQLSYLNVSYLQADTIDTSQITAGNVSTGGGDLTDYRTAEDEDIINNGIISVNNAQTSSINSLSTNKADITYVNTQDNLKRNITDSYNKTETDGKVNISSQKVIEYTADKTAFTLPVGLFDGFVRWNNTTPSSVNTLYVSKTDAYTTNYSQLLENINNRTYIKLKLTTDDTKTQVYEIATKTVRANCVEYNVVFKSSSYNFLDGDIITYAFTDSGTATVDLSAYSTTAQQAVIDGNQNTVINGKLDTSTFNSTINNYSTTAQQAVIDGNQNTVINSKIDATALTPYRTSANQDIIDGTKVSTTTLTTNYYNKTETDERYIPATSGSSVNSSVLIRDAVAPLVDNSGGLASCVMSNGNIIVVYTADNTNTTNRRVYATIVNPATDAIIQQDITVINNSSSGTFNYSSGQLCVCRFVDGKIGVCNNDNNGGMIVCISTDNTGTTWNTPFSFPVFSYSEASIFPAGNGVGMFGLNDVGGKGVATYYTSPNTSPTAQANFTPAVIADNAGSYSGENARLLQIDATTGLMTFLQYGSQNLYYVLKSTNNGTSYSVITTIARTSNTSMLEMVKLDDGNVVMAMLNGLTIQYYNIPAPYNSIGTATTTANITNLTRLCCLEYNDGVNPSITYITNNNLIITGVLNVALGTITGQNTGFNATNTTSTLRYSVLKRHDDTVNNYVVYSNLSNVYRNKVINSSSNTTDSFVNTTNNQTIGGVKTFTEQPVIAGYSTTTQMNTAITNANNTQDTNIASTYKSQASFNSDIANYSTTTQMNTAITNANNTQDTNIAGIYATQSSLTTTNNNLTTTNNNILNNLTNNVITAGTITANGNTITLNNDNTIGQICKIVGKDGTITYNIDMGNSRFDFDRTIRTIDNIVSRSGFIELTGEGGTYNLQIKMADATITYNRVANNISFNKNLTFGVQSITLNGTDIIHTGSSGNYCWDTAGNIVYLIDANGIQYWKPSINFLESITTLKVDNVNSLVLVDGTGGSLNATYQGLNFIGNQSSYVIARANTPIITFENAGILKHLSSTVEHRNILNYESKTVSEDIVGKQYIVCSSGKLNPKNIDNYHSRITLQAGVVPKIDLLGNVYDNFGASDLTFGSENNQLISFNTHADKLIRCFRKTLISNDKGYWDAPAGFQILDASCYRNILRIADNKYYSQKIDNASNPPKNDVVNNNVSNDDLVIYLGNSSGANTHVFNRLYWSSRGAGMVGLDVQFQVVLWSGLIAYESSPTFGTW